MQCQSNCDEIIIMQRLGACNFLKCSSNTLIPINYVMDLTFNLLLFPQYLKLMQRNINLNNKQKHTDVMKMTNFDHIAKSAVQCTAGSFSL